MHIIERTRALAKRTRMMATGLLLLLSASTVSAQTGTAHGDLSNTAISGFDDDMAICHTDLVGENGESVGSVYSRVKKGGTLSFGGGGLASGAGGVVAYEGKHLSTGAWFELQDSNSYIALGFTEYEWDETGKCIKIEGLRDTVTFVPNASEEKTRKKLKVLSTLTPVIENGQFTLEIEELGKVTFVGSYWKGGKAISERNKNTSASFAGGFAIAFGAVVLVGICVAAGMVFMRKKRKEMPREQITQACATTHDSRGSDVRAPCSETNAHGHASSVANEDKNHEPGTVHFTKGETLGSLFQGRFLRGLWFARLDDAQNITQIKMCIAMEAGDGHETSQEDYDAAMEGRCKLIPGPSQIGGYMLLFPSSPLTSFEN